MNREEGIKRLETAFYDSIDEAFEAFGGRNFKRVIVFNMKKDQNLEWNAILHKPEALSLELEKIFGSTSEIIERKILKTLSKKLNDGSVLADDLSFEEIIRRLMRKAILKS